MKKWMLIWGTALFGLAFLVGGAFVVLQGLHTQQEVVADLSAEHIEGQDPCTLLTYEGARPPEGVEVPRVLVDTAEEAHCQALVIRTHTLSITGGKTYSELGREDPNRALWVTSLTLQNALHQAHVSLELTRFVLGVGVAFLGVGIYTLFFGVPLVQKIVS